MLKGEHISSGLNKAETKDMTILWVIFGGTSCTVPQQNMRFFLSAVQMSPKIEDDCGSRIALFHNFRWPVWLWDLWLDFIVTCYQFRQIKSTLDNDVSDFLADFDCFLRDSDWLVEVVYTKKFAEPFWRGFRRWLHYLSPLGANRNLHKSASFSPRKSVLFTCKLQFHVYFKCSCNDGIAWSFQKQKNGYSHKNRNAAHRKSSLKCGE